MTFNLDTGTQAKVIPAKCSSTIMPNTTVMSDNRKLTGYGGHALRVNGYCNLIARYKEQSITQKIYIVDCNGPPIRGYRACQDLGLIKVVYAIAKATEEERDTPSTNTLSEYPDVFKGVGEFQGECSFRIDLSVAPVVCPPQRVPYALS